MDDILSRDALDGADLHCLLGNAQRIPEGSLTYQVSGVVANLLSPHLIYDENTRVQIENPVEVQGQDGQQIGYASLTIEGEGVGVLRADVTLRDDCEQVQGLRLGRKMYLHAFGCVDARENDSTEFLDFFGGPRYVEYLCITGLVLSEEAPRDMRIKPLGQ